MHKAKTKFLPSDSVPTWLIMSIVGDPASEIDRHRRWVLLHLQCISFDHLIKSPTMLKQRIDILLLQNTCLYFNLTTNVWVCVRMAFPSQIRLRSMKSSGFLSVTSFRCVLSDQITKQFEPLYTSIYNVSTEPLRRMLLPCANRATKWWYIDLLKRPFTQNMKIHPTVVANP